MPHYLTTEELSDRIKFDTRYIREKLKGRVFQEGIHYIKPFGGRKLLFIWEAVEQLMIKECAARSAAVIPLRRGTNR